MRASLERHRERLTDGWAGAGWYTGIDAGRLLFTMDEVDTVIGGGASVGAWLGDARWFHTVDKAWGGRALLDDRSGRANALAAWATASRFDPVVVRARLARHVDETRATITAARLAANDGDAIAATLGLWRAVQLTQIATMEGWGERDNSLGRFGTRFARGAAAHGVDPIARDLDRLAGLDPETLAARWAAVPAWVRLRHDRSFRSRQAAGETVAAEEDRRDTLRVCARYALLEAAGEGRPADAWYGILPAVDVPARLERLTSLIDGLRTGAGCSPD